MVYAYTDNGLTNAGLAFRKLTPDQKIKEYGSIEDWAISIMLGLDRLIYSNVVNSNTPLNNKRNMQINIDLVEHGVFNTDDFKEIMFPYGESFDYKFPATLSHYPVINPKIEVLKGEEISRPFNFMVVDKSSDGFNRTQELRNKLVLDVLINEFTAAVNQESLEQTMKGGPPMAEDEKGKKLSSIQEINKYLTYQYTDLLEEKLSDILRYLADVDLLKLKFNKNFIKFLCTGSEIYHVDIINGSPSVRLINPLHFDCDSSGQSDFIENCNWVRESEFISVAEVLNRYHEELTEEDIDSIERNKGFLTTATGFNDYYHFIDPIVNQYNANFIRVSHFEWVSLKKVGVYIAIDKTTGEEIDKDIVDYDFKKKYKQDPNIKETIEWTWVNERWKGIRIGPEVFIKVQPVPNQYDTITSLSKSTSYYVGTRSSFSLVDKLKPYQYLYNVIWFQIKKLMAAAKGKGFVMDIAQIPKSQGQTIERFMHMLDTYNIAFINSLEQDENTNQRSTFNQFQTIDRTMGDAIQGYIMQLQFIEQSMGQVCGISPQREGQVHQNETYGGVERSVTQSNSITESLFYIHNECKRRVVERMLDMAKIAWKDGIKVQYIMDDLGRKLIELNDNDFKNSELGIIISNSGEDAKILQSLQEAAAMALQQQQITLKDFVETIGTKSISKIKNLLSDAEEHNMQKQQAQQAQQGEQAQQQQQQQLQFEQQKMQIETDSKMQIEQLKSETAIKVAEINAESKVMAFGDDINVDVNENGIIDAVERDKIALQREIKNKELGIKQQEVDVKKQDSETKKKEVEVKKEQGKVDLQISKNDITKQEMEMKKMDKQVKLDEVKSKLEEKKFNLQTKSNKDKVNTDKQKLAIHKEKAKLTLKKKNKK